MSERARNSIRGRKAQQAGDQFESWLNAQHEQAKRLGILAHVEKTQARTAVVRRKLIYTGKGVADYVGTLEGGKSLALEAKSTQEDRFPRNEISAKQQEHLGVVARAGGLALLLVEFRDFVVNKSLPARTFRFAIPWLALPWETLRTAESVSPLDVSQWRVDERCYLSAYHPGGVSSSSHARRVYARE